MAVLIFERAIHVNPETGQMRSYWEQHWPLEKLAKKWRALTSGPFGAGYQNDPTALSGNALLREWLQFYDPEDLKAHRERLSVDHGTYHQGADPTRGGSGRDPDFFACVRGERLENRLYLTDFFNLRLKIDDQAQFLEDWTDARGSITSGVIEDSAEKGYVWNDLQQVNDGLGTKQQWIVEKAQGKNAVGAKELRFLAMAPRFQRGQVLVPGVRDANGDLKVDPRWDIFVQEWCSFPSGHDDLLDATYWCCWAAFGKEAPVAGSKGGATRPKVEVGDKKCEREAHLAFGKPVDKCARCMSELVASPKSERDATGSQAPPTMGAQRYQRSSVGMGLRGRS